MNRLYYAGIGSRNTPKFILELMTKLSSKLEKDGLILRTSECEGADRAFISGVKEPHHKEIYTIEEEYNEYSKSKEPTIYLNGEKIYFTEQAMQSVYEYSLEPEITIQDKAYLMLSYFQIFGYEDKGEEVLHCNPVEFVICWTEDGCSSHLTRTKKTGMTGQGISLADTAYIYIPIYNLQNEEHRQILINYLSGSITVKELITGEYFKPDKWNKIEEHLEEIKKLTEENLTREEQTDKIVSEPEDEIPF